MTLLPRTPPGSDSLDDAFPGDSDMAARMRAFDWASTPLGPVETWSPSLRSMVKILLANRFPLLLWWGPQYISIYNDAYRPVLGDKHPWALGQPVSECWSEIWHVLQPLIDTPFNGGPATWVDDLFVEINRHGFVEETHFTVAYSPVPDDAAPGGIGGVLATVHETTQQVLQVRRTAALRDLSARASDGRTVEEACAIAAEALGRNPKDIPFALIYLIDADQQAARLMGAAGVERGASAAPETVNLAAAGGQEPAWPLGSVVHSEQPLVVENLSDRFTALPAGPWSDPPGRALILPLPSNLQHHLAGLLVLGISVRLELDDFYRSFCELATSQVATAIANARAYQEERERAEALAALDRAKTAFFSDVSHEFRTPLTLLLGPLQDLLEGAAGPLSVEQGVQARMAQRNALRLLRLVNTLLDFSRIEAGRTDASYELVDLAALTADLASAFRSAVERAGLRLIVDCPPLPAGIELYVDRDMWEKIVLNLLSNAFKFTLDGEIAVELRRLEGRVELSVRDTGVGIPAEELPHLFERFHRVRGAQARTQEGSGIGLALVQELVRLHGGTVRVQSDLGGGTTFTVSIPAGTAHLPADRVNAARGLASTAIGAASYVEEARRWQLDDVDHGAAAADDSTALAADVSGAPRTAGWGRSDARVLLADDNADMREYLIRLLSPHWRVQAVADGRTALNTALAEPPDLVLSDVMMPGLDGFALLRALRADPRTSQVPIVLLSARAGEEARLEGMEAGADDYLVKPFSARELVARVGAHLELARVRAEATERERQARAEAEAANRAKDEFLAVLSHELRTPLTPILGFTEMLRRGRVSPEMLSTALEMIERSARAQARLVEDLLDVSRILAGKLPLQLSPVALLPVVEAALAAVQPTLRANGVALVTSLDPAADMVWGDADRLQQVVGNLLANAAKFTPSGGRVIVQLVWEEQAVCLSVADTGVGIAPEFLSHLFERFRQADASTTRQYGGLGLGLAIAHHLVESHGGTLTAASEGIGQGATFTLRLPRYRATELAQPAGGTPAPVADSRPLAGLSALVVEDHDDTRTLIQLILEEAGARVATASSSAQGLAALATARPDAIVADIGLPGEDGYGFIARVRQLPPDAGGETPALALSAYASEEDRQRALAAGFQRHLHKPVDAAVLVRTLAGMTGRG